MILRRDIAVPTSQRRPNLLAHLGALALAGLLCATCLVVGPAPAAAAPTSGVEPAIALVPLEDEPPAEGKRFTAQIDCTVDGETTQVDCSFTVTGEGSCAVMGDGQRNGDRAIAQDTAGAITIPASVECDGFTLVVTSVGDYAFGGVSTSKACTGVTAVNLPDTVALIGAFAFGNCTSLEEFPLPANLATIGDHAFYCCSALPSTLVMPQSVQTIASYAFCRCTSLKTIEFLDDAPEVGAYAFTGQGMAVKDVIYRGTCIEDERENRFNSESVGLPRFWYTITFYAAADVVPMGPSQALGVALVRDYVTYRELSSDLNGTALLREGAVPDWPAGTNLWVYGENIDYNSSIKNSHSAYAVQSNYRNLTKAKVQVNAAGAWLSYTGMPIDPKIKIIDTIGGVLVEGVDYSLVFQRMGTDGEWEDTDNLTDPGDIHVIIEPTATSRYTGSASADYTISFEQDATFVHDVEYITPDGVQTTVPCWFRVTALGDEAGTLSVACGNHLFVLDDRPKPPLFEYPRAVDTSLGGELVIPRGFELHGWTFTVTALDQSAFGNHEWFGEGGARYFDAISCGLTKITVPDTVQTFGQDLFRGMTSLKTIVFDGDFGNAVFKNAVFKGAENISTAVWLGKKPSDQYIFATKTEVYCTPENYYKLDFYQSAQALEAGEEPVGTAVLSERVNLGFMHDAVDLDTGLWSGAVPDYPEGYEDDGRWFAPMWCLPEVDPDAFEALKSYLNNSTYTYAQQTNDAYTVDDAQVVGLADGAVLKYTGRPVIDLENDIHIASATGRTLVYGTDYTLEVQRESAIDGSWNPTDNLVMGGNMRLVVRGAGSYRNFQYIYFSIDAPDLRLGDTFTYPVIVETTDGGQSTVDCWFRVAAGNNGYVAEVYRSTGSAVSADTAGKVLLPDMVEFAGSALYVAQIGDNAFANCSQITGVQIPESLTRVGKSAFYRCSSLTEIDLPASVNEMGQYAFGSCSSLTRASIPGACPIADYAFSACRSLSQIELGEEVPSINQYAFASCTSLTTLTLHHGVQQVSSDAFLNSKVSRIVFADDVTSIPSNLLASSATITEIELPDGLESIGSGAFTRSGLTSVIIPASVTVVGNNAFANCASLARVDFLGDPNAIDLRTPFTSCRRIDAVVYHADALANTSAIFTSSFTGHYAVVTFYASAGEVGTGEPLGQSVVRLGTLLRNVNEGTVATGDLLEGETPELPEGSNIWCFGEDVPLNRGVGRATNAWTRNIDLEDLSYGFAETPDAYRYTGEAIDPAALGDLEVIDPRGYTVDPSAYAVTYQRDVDGSWVDTDDLVSRGAVQVTATALEGSGYHGAATGRFSITNYLVGDTLVIEEANGVPVTYSVTKVADELQAGEVAVGMGGEDGQAIAENTTGAVAVPSQIADEFDFAYVVTSVSDHAFYRRMGVTSISIPETVETIGSLAFAYERVKTDTATSALETVVIGSNMDATQIADDAFVGCDVLQNAVFLDRACDGSLLGPSQDITRWYTVRYYDRDGKLVAAVTQREGTYPDSVSPADLWPGSSTAPEAAEDYEWRYDRTALDSRGTLINSMNVREVKSDQSAVTAVCQWRAADGTVTNVDVTFSKLYDEDFAFIGEVALGNRIDGTSCVAAPGPGTLVVPAAIEVDGETCPVTAVGAYAFGSTEADEADVRLAGIELPVSVKSIDQAAFQNCSALAHVAFADGSALTSIGGTAFENCSALGAIDLPEGLATIGTRAFAGSGLVRLRVPFSVTTLGKSACTGCPRLHEVVIGGAMSLSLPAPSGAAPSWIAATMEPDPQLGGSSNASGLAVLDDWTFSDCPLLERVVFDCDASALVVSEQAFENDAAIVTVVYGDRRPADEPVFGESHPDAFVTMSYFANVDTMAVLDRSAAVVVADRTVYGQREPEQVLTGEEPVLPDYYEWVYGCDVEAPMLDSAYTYAQKIHYAIDTSGVDPNFTVVCTIDDAVVDTGTYEDTVTVEVSTRHAVQPGRLTVTAADGTVLLDVDGASGSFTMPGSPVSVAVDPAYSLAVSIQNIDGSIVELDPVDLSTLLEMADGREPLDFGAYGDRKNAVVFTTGAYVPVDELFEQLDVEFVEGDSLYIKLADGSSATTDYSTLHQERFWFPFFAYGEIDEGVAVPSVLALTFAQHEADKEAPAASYAGAPKLLMGQTEENVMRTTSTTDDLAADITSIVVVKGAVDIARCDVSLEANEFAWTGDEVRPAVTVLGLNGEELTEDVDFEVEYIDAVGPGVATAQVHGIGYYRGTVELPFRVLRAQPIAGASAVATAAEIALDAFPQGCDSVIIATSSGWYDALCASGLAGVLDCPVLLTGKSKLSADTADAIVQLSYGHDDFQAIIVGGPAAVSLDVEASIAAIDTVSQVSRLGGANMYDTAYLIYLYGANVGEGWSDTAIVASGKSYYDALSVSSYAAWAKCPIIPTNGKVITDDFSEALSSGGFTHVLVPGGPAAVPDAIVNTVEGIIGPDTVERAYGDNAYGTSAAIARWSIEQGMSAQGAGIATGKTFYDALCGGPALGRSGSVLLLVSPTNTTTLDVLAENAEQVTHIRFLGGLNALPQEVRTSAIEKLGWSDDVLE